MCDGGPSAVLFDMDGTLLDSEKIWDVSLDDLAEHLGGRLSRAGREEMLGANMSASLTVLFAELGRPADPDELARAGRWLIDRTAELFDAGLPWRPGGEEILDAVREAGLRTALVTNTERYLTDRALDTLGAERFDVTVCGDEVARGKPAPDIYERAAALLQLEPGECLAVEDSPTGTAAAESAGCPVLVVPSEVAVEAGPKRHQVSSLVGLTAGDLVEAWRTLRRAS